jgi:aldose 1-epimerase
MDEIVIADGPLEVVVLPDAGARLHRVRAFGRDIILTPDDPATHLADPFFWGSYVMAPWCNRIEARPTAIGSRTIDLASNFPDGTAIHGQVYLRPWTRAGEGSFVVSAGGDGWPWTYDVRQTVTVDGTTLRIDLGLTNTSDDPMPAGMGIHPWFLRPVQVAVHADEYFADNLATEPRPAPVAGAYDLRGLAPMADDLDGTWTSVAEPPVELQWDEVGLRATMRTQPPAPYIVAASPGRVGAVAVEPETHAPQAVRRLLGGEPGGLLMLPAGETLRLAIDLSFEAVGPSR